MNLITYVFNRRIEESTVPRGETRRVVNGVMTVTRRATLVTLRRRYADVFRVDLITRFPFVLIQILRDVRL